MLKSSCALVSRTVLGTIVALGAFALGMGDANAEPAEVELAEAAPACDPGYREGINGCDDINECWEGADNCSADAVCVNRIGSFTCHCNEGFEGDGVTCTSTEAAVTPDECASATDCEPNMACVTDDGPAYCACKPGYREGIYGCDDINECWEGTDDCSDDASCVNRMGSFSCRVTSKPKLRSAVLSSQGLASAKQGLSADAEEDDDADTSADGAMCSTGAMGGTDPSAVAMVLMAASVLVSRRRKG